MIPLFLALADASPCEEAGLPEGPVAISVRDGEHGMASRLCPRTEAGLGAAALALDDTGNNNIYGQIRIDAVLDGAVALSEDHGLTFRLEAFRQHQVISLHTATYTGLGHLSVGSTHVLGRTDRLAYGLTSRLVLPTAFGLYQNQWPVAADVGGAAVFEASSAVRLHGNLNLGASIGLGRGPKQARGLVAPTVGVELRPGKAFSTAISVASSFGEKAALDWLAPGVSFRFGAGDLGIALDAQLPLVGRTPRPLGTGGLSVTYRLD